MTQRTESRNFVRSKFPIVVHLLNSEILNLTAEKSSTVAEVFSDVCNYLGLYDTDIFGLAQKTENGMLFLNPVSRISSTSARERTTSLVRKLSLLRSSRKLQSFATINGHSLPVSDDCPVFYFRVRFYIPNHCLHGRKVRHLYYQQIKHNVLHYGLLCSDDVYFQLAAYALQAALDAEVLEALHGGLPLEEGVVNLSHFFPLWLIDAYGADYLIRSIPTLIRKLVNIPRDALEFRYIRLASEASSNFNLHLYQVSPLYPTPVDHVRSESQRPVLRRSFSRCSHSNISSGCGSFWLGISPYGLEFHEEYKNQRLANINRIHWDQVLKLSYKNNCLLVQTGEVARNQGQAVVRGKLTFYTPSLLVAERLFMLGSQMHSYQTTARLCSLQSAQQLEQDERRQYNETYIYSDGEVVTSTRIHGVPDAENGQKLLSDDYESPNFPEISPSLFPSSQKYEERTSKAI
uniref:FERM domain-containing protein 1 n=2 Tax=Schistocephalus solidus TaxID=70667 RepID=A0A0X3NKN9_SCHSO